MSSFPRRQARLQNCTLSLLTAAILLAGTQATPVMAATAPAQPTHNMGDYHFAIARQSMVSALNAFSAVTGWQIGLPAELAEGVTSAGVHGSLSPEKALDRLLAGTHLSYRKLGNNNIVLEKRSNNGALDLQQMTISATRQEQGVDSVPSTVSVHERRQLDRNNVNTIKELVRNEPGVSVGGTGQRSGATGYNIRGIDGDRVLTQVDGVEIPASFYNGPYANTQRNYVDPEIVKRVEILRGPASVLYGSNAIGGAVSYFTLDPDDIIKPGEDVGARLKAGYSSADDSWLKSATVAGRADAFDGLVHFSRRDGHETESYGSTGGTGLDRTKANPEDARTTSLLAKLGWNYNDSDRLQLAYEKYKDDRDTNQLSAVGGPFNTQAPGVGSNSYRARSGNDTITRERFGLEHSFGLDSLLADHAKWSLNYQIAKTDQSTEENYIAGTRDVMRYRDTYYKDRQWVLDAQLDKAFALGDTDHLLTYGFNLKHQKVTGLRNGSCQALVGTCGATDGLATQSDFPDPTVNVYGLFVQDEIRWNQWTFLPGLRYDRTTLKPDLTNEYLTSLGTSTYVPDDSTQTWQHVSPKLGVTYAFDDHYTWFGQYAEGFRTPMAKELYGRFENTNLGYVQEPNPDLDPETSRSLETGLRGSFEGGNFDVALFYNRYRDFIDNDIVGYVTSGFRSTTVYQSRNISRASIRGVEAKGRLNLDSFGALPGLYAQGSIAYSRGRDDDSGKPLGSINPLTGVFGLGYEQERFGGQLNWTLVKRKTRVDDTKVYTVDGTSTQYRTPGFGILDLTGYYKLTDDLTVNAGLYNLTDKKYWLWDDVRGYASGTGFYNTFTGTWVGESTVTAPANLDRLTQPGRNFAINLIWDI